MIPIHLEFIPYTDDLLLNLFFYTWKFFSGFSSDVHRR